MHVAHPQGYEAVGENKGVTRRHLLAGVAGLALPVMADADTPRAAPALGNGQARLEAAKRGLAQVDKGRPGVDWLLVHMWARRVVDAELALCCRPAERKAALEAFVRRARDAERVVREMNKTGAVTLMEMLEVEYFRADAEALFAEEEARKVDAV
jgi:hypothetical protein